MAKIIPFPNRRPQPPAPELPVDSIPAVIARNPTRALCKRRCNRCGFRWQQPAPEGLCPKCHSEDTHTYDLDACNATRV